MAKYRKKAIIVTADIAETHQYIATLEGITEAEVGDYIVNGVDNEQWAVKPKWFKESYRHIADNQYQRISQVLEAVQVKESEIVTTPTGDIEGDKGDYRVTGTKGEQWFVKPDIFEKTYDLVKGGYGMTTIKEGTFNNMTPLQEAISQVGLDAVQKSMGTALLVAYCDLHGHYAHMKGEEASCPVCPSANGVTATEVEHYINVQPIQGINPHQKMNPVGF